MFLAALVAAASIYADIPRDLAQAAVGYDEAQVHGSRAGLERWLAEDYLLLNSSGSIETKRQFIADSTAPGFTLEPFSVEQPIHKVWRDGAVLGGIATLRGTDGGKPYRVRLRFADVWAKRNGRWQVIYTQVAKAP